MGVLSFTGKSSQVRVPRLVRRTDPIKENTALRARAISEVFVAIRNNFSASRGRAESSLAVDTAIEKAVRLHRGSPDNPNLRALADIFLQAQISQKNAEELAERIANGEYCFKKIR